MTKQDILPAVFVYRLLGIKQQLFFNWQDRHFFESTKESKDQRKKYFDFNEVCWACIFFFFARGVRADHKTVLTWRSLVLGALERGDNFLSLYYGKNLAFPGWASTKTNSLLQVMARWNFSGEDFKELNGKIQGNVASIVVDLGLVRKFVETAMEQYES